MDGNKRAAFLAMTVFVGLNGSAIEAEETDVVSLMLGVAGSQKTEDDLADWLRVHLVPLRSPRD